MTKQTLQYRFIIGALWLMALLPLRILYVFSDFICFVIHRVVKYRVKVVRKNLKKAFPHKSEHELQEIENEFYHHLCDTIVETVKLLHISDKEIKKRVTLNNVELIGETAERGEPFILFLGHYGNWEWVQSLTIMTDRPEVMGALYKPLGSKVMDRVMLRIRSRFKLRCISNQNAYKRLLEIREENPLFGVGFIADQRPLGGAVKHWTTLLGQPTAYVTGGETIGKKLGVRFLYVECEKLKRGYYRLNFEEVNPDPSDKDEFPYTRQFLKLLEGSIRKAPAYWLWSHNRWRAKPPKDFAAG